MNGCYLKNTATDFISQIENRRIVVYIGEENICCLNWIYPCIDCPFTYDWSIDTLSGKIDGMVKHTSAISPFLMIANCDL